MTQPKFGKILSALHLNKNRTILFLGRPYTRKRVLPIKTWIITYKLNISHILYRCEIYLGVTLQLCKTGAEQNFKNNMRFQQI